MNQICKNLSIVLVLSFLLLMSGCNNGEIEEAIPPICDDNQTLVNGECIDNEVSDTTAPVILGIHNWTYIANEERPNYLEGVSANDDTDGDLTNEMHMDLSHVDYTVEGIYDIYYTIEDVAGNITTETVTVTVTVFSTDYDGFLEEDMENLTVPKNINIVNNKEFDCAEDNVVVYHYLSWWKVFESSESIESCCIIRYIYIDEQRTRKCIFFDVSD